MGIDFISKHNNRLLKKESYDTYVKMKTLEMFRYYDTNNLKNLKYFEENPKF